jgi:hypothetical protein
MTQLHYAIDRNDTQRHVAIVSSRPNLTLITVTLTKKQTYKHSA